jgi:hypothetical protein
MKLRPIVSISLVAFVLALSACAHSSHRDDWRAPQQHAATPCASDADCHGGTCQLDPSTGPAGQGTCLVPQNPQQNPDGSELAPSQAPNQGPTVQPSPNDIQL